MHPLPGCGPGVPEIEDGKVNALRTGERDPECHGGFRSAQHCEHGWPVRSRSGEGRNPVAVALPPGPPWSRPPAPPASGSLTGGHQRNPAVLVAGMSSCPDAGPGCRDRHRGQGATGCSPRQRSPPETPPDAGPLRAAAVGRRQRTTGDLEACGGRGGSGDVAAGDPQQIGVIQATCIPWGLMPPLSRPSPSLTVPGRDSLPGASACPERELVDIDGAAPRVDEDQWSG